MLRDRVLSAVVGLPLIWLFAHYAALCVPRAGYGAGFVVGMVAIALLAMSELLNPMARKGHAPAPLPACLGAAILLPAVWLVGLGDRLADPALGHVGSVLLIISFLVASVGALLAAAFRGTTEGAVRTAATSVLVFAYVPFLFSYALRLRQMDLPGALGDPHAWLFWRESGAVFLVVMTTWTADTGAYALGKTIGRRPLAPRVSPKKTIEGAIGFFASAVGTALICCALMGVPLRHGCAIGAIIGVVGQFGDLAESALKRDMDIKDSGTIIPGHGGILDRCDALLFAMPAAYYYLLAVGVR
ncbi:MAG: phosphatidate cytidylyltransferase [Armatimonadota bacterium]